MWLGNTSLERFELVLVHEILKNMIKLRAAINAVKTILRVGGQDKKKTQSLLSVQITDCVLRRDP